MINPIPSAWLPRCKMKRIILHWTEGRHLANAIDRAHYHFLIEQTANCARIIRGDHTIADNVSTADGRYAAHTRGCNTGSIGLALCGMMNCRETPFSPGPVPFTQEQWDLFCRATAQLCHAYTIPCDDRHVLAHGEVQKNLGIRQLGKWDPMVLPWEPTLPGAVVMKRTRERILECLNTTNFNFQT
jgi:N-acetyl-anhydromuramyl-L-alanine amidase AmpD